MNSKTDIGRRITVLSSTIFGDLSRYRVEECRTRFGTIEWMVFDAEITDEITNRPACIRQASTRADAIDGLT